LHACDSEEAVAAGRDHILTATPLSDDLKAQIVADSLSFPRRATNGRGTGSSRTSQPGRAIEVPVTVIVGENDRLEPNRCCATTYCPT